MKGRQDSMNSLLKKIGAACCWPSRKTTVIAIGTILAIGAIFFFVQGGRLSRAVLSRLSQLTIGTPRSYLGEGEQLLDSGHYDQAVTAFSKAIEQGNELARSYAGRGDSYFGLRHFDKAINDYTASLQHDLTLRALIGRCNAYRMLAKFELARKDCEAALGLEPQSAELHVGLGLLYLELQDYTRARDEVGRAIQVAPDSVNAYYALAQIEMALGSIDKAIVALSKCIELDPTDLTWYWERGFLHYLSGQMNPAVEDLQFVLKHGKPDIHGELMFRAGTLLRSLGKTP